MHLSKKSFLFHSFLPLWRELGYDSSSAFSHPTSYSPSIVKVPPTAIFLDDRPPPGEKVREGGKRKKSPRRIKLYGGGGGGNVCSKHTHWKKREQLPKHVWYNCTCTCSVRSCIYCTKNVGVCFMAFLLCCSLFFLGCHFLLLCPLLAMSYVTQA